MFDSDDEEEDGTEEEDDEEEEEKEEEEKPAKIKFIKGELMITTFMISCVFHIRQYQIRRTLLSGWEIKDLM